MDIGSLVWSFVVGIAAFAAVLAVTLLLACVAMGTAHVVDKYVINGHLNLRRGLRTFSNVVTPIAIVIVLIIYATVFGHTILYPKSP